MTLIAVESDASVLVTCGAELPFVVYGYVGILVILVDGAGDTRGEAAIDAADTFAHGLGAAVLDQFHVVAAHLRRRPHAGLLLRRRQGVATSPACLVISAGNAGHGEQRRGKRQQKAVCKGSNLQANLRVSRQDPF